ncbi:MAG: hypothetical protein ABJG78_18250 [Cyclobacteriaceae bacterium]
MTKADNAFVNVRKEKFFLRTICFIIQQQVENSQALVKIATVTIGALRHSKGVP